MGRPFYQQTYELSAQPLYMQLPDSAPAHLGYQFIPILEAEHWPLLMVEKWNMKGTFLVIIHFISHLCYDKKTKKNKIKSFV